MEDFRVSPAATPEGPHTPLGSPPPIRAAREGSRPPPLMMDLGDSPEPTTPTTPTTPPFSPLLRTPPTYTPPGSPPPLRGRADDDAPPRMMDLAHSPSPVAADPDQIKRFFDAIKANNISDTRDVMQRPFSEQLRSSY